MPKPSHISSSRPLAYLCVRFLRAKKPASVLHSIPHRAYPISPSFNSRVPSAPPTPDTACPINYPQHPHSPYHPSPWPPLAGSDSHSCPSPSPSPSPGPHLTAHPSYSAPLSTCYQHSALAASQTASALSRVHQHLAVWLFRAHWHRALWSWRCRLQSSRASG